VRTALGEEGEAQEYFARSEWKGGHAEYYGGWDKWQRLDSGRATDGEQHFTAGTDKAIAGQWFCYMM